MIKIPSSWEKIKKRQVKELTKILLLRFPRVLNRSIIYISLNARGVDTFESHEFHRESERKIQRLMQRNAPTLCTCIYI